MKLTSKIALALGLIVSLTSCGSGESKKEEAPKEETKTETKETGDTAKSSDPINIKIGVVGEFNEVLEEVIKRYEEGTGNTAELVKFADYNQPNEALASGDIDLNAFQHHKFLNEFNSVNKMQFGFSTLTGFPSIKKNLPSLFSLKVTNSFVS